MPSLQETFDTIVNHLRRQNAKSQHKPDPEESWECAYRGENGMMCAAGCLIPDELYKKSFEGVCPVNYDDGVYVKSKISYFLEKDKLTSLFLSLGHDIKLVREMQQVHDAYNVPDWEEQFQNVADQFNLVLRKKTA